MKVRNMIMLALIVSSIVAPALAGEKYLYGSPELSASIAGTNEFNPGDMVTLTIMLENEGLNTVKIVQSTLITRDDLPNLAKMVSATLTGGDAPVSVKSDTQMVGDIPGGATIPVTFLVKIEDEAVPGTYILPMDVSYTHLNTAEQHGADTITYYYNTREETIPVAIRIKPDIAVEVVDLSTESLNVGTEGYLSLQVKNAGHEYGKSAVARIIRNGNSPLVPTDDSVYIGEFAPESVTTLQFKVAVSAEAEEQVYPIDFMIEYENGDGEPVTTDALTIGVPVGGKIDFDVVSDPADIRPGEKAVIEVTYLNTGAATVYNALARISAVDPFSSNDDTAFLGDLAPGESATARFEIDADDSATIKQYGLDSEIRYTDALGNSQISDTMKVPISIVSASGAATIFSNPLVISVIVVALLGAGYYVMKKRKES